MVLPEGPLGSDGLKHTGLKASMGHRVGVRAGVEAAIKGPLLQEWSPQGQGGPAVLACLQARQWAGMRIQTH